jgi:hypothetical protein
MGGNTTDWLVIQWRRVLEDTGPAFETTFKSHYDNVIVLLMEKDKLDVGEMFTFQDPTLSADVNVGVTKGRLIQRGSINLKYACRSLGQGECNTIYATPNTEGAEQDYLYPGDLEYFQVIKEIPLSAFTLENYVSYGISSPGADIDSNGFINATTGTLTDNIYSLPWRFLNSQFSSRADYINSGDYTMQDPSFLNSNATITYTDVDVPPTTFYVRRPEYYNKQYEKFTNDFPIFNLSTQPSYQGVSYGTEANTFMQNIVFEYSYETPATMVGQPPFQVVGADNEFFEPGIPYNYNAGKYGGRVGYDSDIMKSIATAKEYVVYILQRGVDPYSPKIPMKIDLSRLFGHEEYNANNGQFIVEGEFRMNIPIQVGNTDFPGDYNPSGLILPRHCVFDDNDFVILDFPFATCPIIPIFITGCLCIICIISMESIFNKYMYR